MAQFYSLTWAGDLNGTRVMNTLWYRSPAVGLPTDADLDAIEDYFQAQIWPLKRAFLSSQYRLRQTIVQGYRDTWLREPYLPLIRDFDSPANLAVASAAPLTCAILSFRVVPKVPGPHYRGPGLYEDLPVRRGYLAISGIPATAFNANGSVDPAWYAGANPEAFRVRVVNTIIIATQPDPLVPVRVSGLAKDRIDRGYGEVAGAVWRPETSSRRSRKLGKGV